MGKIERVDEALQAAQLDLTAEKVEVLRMSDWLTTHSTLLLGNDYKGSTAWSRVGRLAT